MVQRYTVVKAQRHAVSTDFGDEILLTAVVSTRFGNKRTYFTLANRVISFCSSASPPTTVPERRAGALFSINIRRSAAVFGRRVE